MQRRSGFSSDARSLYWPTFSMSHWIIAEGTDWRFFNALQKELKG
jgi:hypothetical protein